MSEFNLPFCDKSFSITRKKMLIYPNTQQLNKSKPILQNFEIYQIKEISELFTHNGIYILAKAQIQYLHLRTLIMSFSYSGPKTRVPTNGNCSIISISRDK